MKRSLTVAYKYAKALFLMTDESERDGILELLKASSEMFSDKKAREFLQDPTFPRSEAVKLILEFLGDVPEIFKNFVVILAEKKRLLYLPTITNAYEQILDESRSKIKVLVETAVALSNEELKLLEEFIERESGMRPLFQIQIKPELIAGMVVHFQDRVLDLSASGRLKRLEYGLK
ncbi:ATP synthase F1 subunit delta [Kosmotoga sp.]|uniref:ATP synthase F1 subunit delta n=1 Tax=Kosmotoga sp. TaxID=1955248 RepID=UPI0024AB1521|nr:ATP synthase F1 subunit delta [Kosmotoga sp.]MDI3524273.1 F-type H+-transporting ATPase subunit delta [Kosmotoga sp.]